LKKALDLRWKRLRQLSELGPVGIGRVIATILEDDELPEAGYHYGKHRCEFPDVQEMSCYVRLLREHNHCVAPRVFTFLRPRDEARMWYTVDELTGAVGLYNETASRRWSFFRPSDLEAFLSGQPFLVEVVQVGQDYEFR